MNKCFSIVWSESQQKYVVASEHARSYGKPRTLRCLALTGLIAALCYPLAAQAGTGMQSGPDPLAQKGSPLSWFPADGGGNAVGSDNSQTLSAADVTTAGSDIWRIYGGLDVASTPDATDAIAGESIANNNTLTLSGDTISLTGGLYGGYALSRAVNGLNTEDADASVNNQFVDNSINLTSATANANQATAFGNTVNGEHVQIVSGGDTGLTLSGGMAQSQAVNAWTLGDATGGNASTYADVYASAYAHAHATKSAATAGSATAEGNTLTDITAGDNSTLSGGMAQSQAVNAWTLGDATGGNASTYADAYADADADAYASTATAGSATAEGNTLTGITAGENSTLSGGMAQSQAVNAWTLGDATGGNASTYAYAYADAYTYTATATAGSATAEGNTLTGITAGENSTLSGGMAQSQAVNAWTLGDATGGAAYASAYAYARAYAYAYTSTATAGSATAEGNTLTGITAGENSTLSGGMAQSQAVNAWTLGDATGGAAYASAYAYARATESTATAGSATAEGNTLTDITAGDNSTLSGGMAQSQAVNAWTLGDATGGNASTYADAYAYASTAAAGSATATDNTLAPGKYSGSNSQLYAGHALSAADNARTDGKAQAGADVNAHVTDDGVQAGTATATTSHLTLAGTTLTGSNLLYGGYAASTATNAHTTGSGDAMLNIASDASHLSSATLEAHSGDATASDNDILVSDSSNISGDLYGGYAVSQAYNGWTEGAGTVQLSTGGGNSYTATAGNTVASNNIVTLGNGTVSGDIYGGYALAEACVSKSVSGGCSDNVSSTDTVNVTTGTATASNNTVILDGSNGSGNLSQANLYGGVALTRQGAAEQAGITEGNTLAVQGFDGTVNSVQNFQKYQFEADASPQTEDTVLTVTSAVDFTGVTDMTVDLSASDYNSITSDAMLTDDILMASDTGITGFDPATVSFTGTTTDVPDYLTIDPQVVQNNNQLVLNHPGLSWNAALNAHGTFTPDKDKSFEVTSVLADVTDSSKRDSLWDGTTLTKAGDGTLILSGDNTYTGGTNINGGTLDANSLTALGTGDVTNHATLNLNAAGEYITASLTTDDGGVTSLAAGTTLTTGTLDQQDGSTLNINLGDSASSPVITADSASLDGTLNITGIGNVTDSLTSDPYTFTLIDTDSAISGDFDTLTIAGMDARQTDFLTVDGRVDGSQYQLAASLSWYADVDGAATDAHGTFTLSDPDGSFEVSSVLADVSANSGWDGKTLTKAGDGTLILSAANTYSGDTDVNGGTLWLTDTGVIGATGSTQNVNVASGATFGGTGVVNGNVSNSGSIAMSQSATETGHTLTINGDYSSNNGNLYMNTYMGDDSSPTDKLVISGDTSGKTTVYFTATNPGEDGAATSNGIEVIDVGGSSGSEDFTQGNRVVMGAYEYRLYQHTDSDWYLESKANDDDDGGDVIPPDGGGDVTPGVPQYRADIGAYLGNQWMARNLQMQTLYDREGSQLRSDDGSVWMRFRAGRADSGAAGGSIDIDHNYSQIQFGGDIAAWGNGEQSLTVGLMGSYINADSDSTGNKGADGSQFSASGNVDGYNLGVYATWFADARNHSGLYVDSWYQYGFYNNSVSNEGLGSEDYDSSASAVSLETGYRYDIGLSNGNTVSLTPQAQATWQHYTADSVTDHSNTRIDGQDSDIWTTRLGLRIDGKLHNSKAAVIQPFMEVNWLHTSDDTSVSFNDMQVDQDIPANRAELKVGIQANLNSQWSVSAQAAGQTGSNDYRDLNGSLNVRYSW